MHQIVEDILAAQQREHEFDLYVQEEMQKLPPCESRVHAQGKWGHVPDQPASFLSVAPCGCDMLKCAGWVYETQSGFEFILCDSPGGCGEYHLVSEYLFIPLDMSDR